MLVILINKLLVVFYRTLWFEFFFKSGCDYPCTEGMRLRNNLLYGIVTV